MNDVTSIPNFHQFVKSRTNEECAINRWRHWLSDYGTKRTEAELNDKTEALLVLDDQ